MLPAPAASVTAVEPLDSLMVAPVPSSSTTVAATISMMMPL